VVVLEDLPEDQPIHVFDGDVCEPPIVPQIPLEVSRVSLVSLQELRG
jgi:hypothetical protein